MKKTILILSMLFVLSILFLSSCSEDDPAEEKDPVDQIVIYEDITLGGVDLAGTTGSYFSTKTGEVYTTSELNETIGPDIDIVFVGMTSLRFFESPSADLSGWDLTDVPNGTETKFINYIESSDIEFSSEDFDEMTDAVPVKDLTIDSDDDAFPTTVPRVIPFVNSAGKKGVIRVTNIEDGDDGSITFDIKIQE